MAWFLNRAVRKKESANGDASGNRKEQEACTSAPKREKDDEDIEISL